MVSNEIEQLSAIQICEGVRQYVYGSVSNSQNKAKNKK